MRIVKTVSLFTIIMVGMSSVSYGASMTSQIRRLMQEKEEKIKTLEQCDGKRKGWMIAGISTIGLTAVGVGVNIAQASKSNRLSDEIDSAKQELDRINKDISDLQAKQDSGNKGQGGDHGVSLNPSNDDITNAASAYCFYQIDGHNKYDSVCGVSDPGDWGVVFEYGTVKGIAACSDLDGHYAEKASDQTKVDAAYTKDVTLEPKGKNCYCKMTEPSNSSWAAAFSYKDAAGCAYNCALWCAFKMKTDPEFVKSSI